MKFLQRLFNHKPEPDNSSLYAEFARQAISGPTECKIAIRDWPDLYHALTSALIASGQNDIIQQINACLYGQCPACYIETAGKGLAALAGYAQSSSRPRFTGNSGGAEHLLRGVCRNYECSCKEIVIFWKPQEIEKDGGDNP